ncbi:DUF6933 domain-containing protein [Guptibacillus hwajinpoensis]|uniref:DUF6933 domain-containing protein n=1 Tax=Guptibacillus hwajinpoensis TaxID=208199 RepID=UPI001927A0BB|nr:hypothetical protein [Pseudalkalibacillus hwajinpoensis]
MLIQCTKKLLQELKVDVVTEVDEDPLYSWHANLIKLGRKKVVVFTNDQNRYAIVLYGVKAKDLKKKSCLQKVSLDPYITPHLDECSYFFRRHTSDKYDFLPFSSHPTSYIRMDE